MYMWRGYLLLPDSTQGPRSPPQLNALFNALRWLIWREIGWSRLHGVREILHTVVAWCAAVCCGAQLETQHTALRARFHSL
jgi:hypothetical protein